MLSKRHQKNKRIYIALFLLASVFALLALRLAWIQFVISGRRVPGGHYPLAKMSKIQSEREVVLDTGRGRLYDRHGLPLAGVTVWTAAFYPQEEEQRGADGFRNADSLRSLRRLAAILGVPFKQLQEKREKLVQPFLWPAKSGGGPLALTPDQAAEISGLQIDGVRVLPFASRPGGSLTGRQWLGHLSEARPKKESRGQGGRTASPGNDDSGLRVTMEGTTGLEKTLEPLLRGVGHTEVYARVDAEGKRLPGSELTVRTPSNPYYPLSLHTTVDLKLQDKIERLAAGNGVKEGAVVVLEAGTGDVTAMVSLPFYDPGNVSPQGGEWNNRALQAAAPGSIFKIVTAAAALEAGLTSPDETFHCHGAYGRYGLSCHKEAGHGALTLEQGFAQSCNNVFASLAERLTAGQLQSAALALGLGRDIGWRQEQVLGLPLLQPLSGEQRGAVFRTLLPDDGGARVQTAIGQRDSTVTPLQAANLVVTLLHGGEVRAPRILREVDFANGQKLMDLPPHLAPAAEGRISALTAKHLRSWMRRVVTEGTGRSLRGARWALAGKSGTAQTLVKGAPRNNQWFIGFGPAEQPEYAVAVLVKNAAPGSPHTATRLFGEVMDLLAEPSGV
ncbi:peptidoglycan D,D-transpeptidase FtsI family protein [Paenibacillus rhizophilus]|uniref:Penicillin-binding protein 2 n=1 Tax=Paenibacillus rhizophilus TaxID=1850366 RepID=A0A3N9Q5F4_9BACL|nr:penicillin-binding transpeptidase domain-containing protein [Paenibacillus rhizophilus]RQW12736.1 penicillin-binding protein 2 [Paenibacillus rhizophilus]